jgi:hypothetical protein
VKPGAVWCKAGELYSRLQYESTVTPNFAFDFGEVPLGLYILSCAADQNVFLWRVVRRSADTMPLTVYFTQAKELDTLE